MSRPRGSYGIDAPYVPVMFVAAAVVALALAFLEGSAWAWSLIAAFFLALAAIYLRTSVSGNDEAHARANLEANGVSDRVTLHTADMRDLPFRDGTVDLVTASFSIHNLKASADRRDAVAAAYRVLKPGGRLLIADISKVKEYRQTLTELGAADIQLRGAGFDGWWSAPWMATTTLTATKPAASAPSA